MEVRSHKKEKLDGSLLVIGFPSRGLVGGLAATYVIDDLRMSHIASIYDPRLPPTMVVRKGVGHSPIQFYASAERCGPDGTCDKLLICQSEIPLEPELLGEAAWSILDWAKKHRVSHVVVLEGVSSASDPLQARVPPAPEKTVVRGVRSMTSKHPFDKYRIRPLEEGIVSSYASAFLMAADDLGVDLLALYIEAHEDLPDARAAALLLRSVDAMMPNIDFKTKELERRAQRVEARMKQTMEASKRQLTEMKRTLDMMYR